ncbi:hypothetical protein [Streptomyces sp. SD15]
MKRTALASSALCVAVLTGLTGCAGGDSGTGAAGDPKATDSPVKELSPTERLAKLMVTAADLGDGFSVKEFSLEKDEFAFAESTDEIALDKVACHPLASVLNQLPLGRPKAFLTHVVSPEESAGGVTYITLATYDEGMATAAMDTLLARAVDSCSLGFTAKANGNSDTYDSVTPEEAGTAGDESLAYKAAITYNGVTHTVRSTVVRSDDVLAVYYAEDSTALADAKSSDAKIPAAVLTAQNAKLG